MPRTTAGERDAWILRLALASSDHNAKDLIFWLDGYRTSDGAIIWGQETLPVIAAPADDSSLEMRDDTAAP